MNLSQKILAAIIVPLLFQLGFLACYAYLLVQSENLNIAESHSSAVVGHINWLSAQLSLKSVSALQYAITGDKEFLAAAENSQNQVSKEIAVIKELYKGDKEAAENIETMSTVGAGLANVCDHVLQSDTQDRGIAGLQCPTIKAKWKRFLTARDSLLSLEKSRHDVIMAKLPTCRESLERWTVIGVVLNLMLAVILTRVLGRGIVRRIQQLTANAKSLAEGKPLCLSPEEGRDEISLLDKNFRSMAEALKEALEREASQARTDSLSGLKNRRAFYETMKHSSALGRRTGNIIAILICDIDNFKSINDKYGHSCGDKAIVAVSELIQSVSRTADIAARWGGEEFIIAMPNSDAQGALLLAERLRQAVEKLELETDLGALKITISAGVSVFDEAQEDLESSIHRADKALYRAKELGRNRVEIDAGCQNQALSAGITVD